MVDIGYESHNSILNMGSLSIFLVIYYGKVVYFGIIWLLYKQFGWFEKHVQSMKESLFYNAILGLCLDGYYEFLISGYLNAANPTFGVNGENMANIVAWVALINSISVPIILIYCLYQSLEYMKSEETKLKAGVLFEGLKMKDKYQAAYYLVFVTRRFIFTIMVFFLNAKGI